MEKCKKLLSESLNCGIPDLDVLFEIDEEILIDAIENLKDEGLLLDFPTLFTECVRIAEEKHGVKVTEIDQIIWLQEFMQRMKNQVKNLRNWVSQFFTNF